MKTTWRALARRAIAALGLSALMASGGLREDEIDCEQAVTHLQECCPGFAYLATLQCEHSSGCAPTETALSIPESQCIMNMPCGDILARSICGRTVDLPSPGYGDDFGDTPVSHEPVCP